MDRYIGLDAHASSCTVAVVGPSGKRLASHVVETNAKALVSVIDAIPKARHLCPEEGTLAGWLHEVLDPHVQELVVTAVPQNRGLNKNFNRTLKVIFKGAAITVIGQGRDVPLCDHYQRLLDGGTKPNLARLTIARQVAAITLALWRNEEVYDPAKLISTARHEDRPRSLAAVATSGDWHGDRPLGYRGEHPLFFWSRYARNPQG